MDRGQFGSTIKPRGSSKLDGSTECVLGTDPKVYSFSIIQVPSALEFQDHDTLISKIYSL